MQPVRFFSKDKMQNILDTRFDDQNLSEFIEGFDNKFRFKVDSIKQIGKEKIKYEILESVFKLLIVRYFVGVRTQSNMSEKSEFNFVTVNEYTFNYSEAILSEFKGAQSLVPIFYEFNDPIVDKILQMKDCKYSEFEILGHYTKMESVIEHILPSKRLLINSFKRANDPFENRKSFKVFIENTEGDVFSSFLKLNHAENELIRAYSKYISFISFSRNTSTSKAYGIPSMWAHYGQNHRGICLVFDKRRLDLLFKDQYRSKYKRDKISYGTLVYPSMAKKMEESPKDFFLNNSKKLFFQKDYCWKAEAEFRFIVIKEKEEEILFLENIDQALIAIVLGDDFNENYQCSVEKLLDALPNKYIGIYKSQFKDGIYELEMCGKELLYSPIDYLNDFYLIDL